MSPDLPHRKAETTRSPFRHAAAIYDSDEGFLRTVIPFVEEGLATGDPIIVTLNPEQQVLLASVIGQPEGISQLVVGEHYHHPLSALRANRTLFESHLQAGAARVRLVGDLPRETPMAWRGWARYEALCNHHLTDLAVTALCTYDIRTTDESVLHDVRRLHALLTDNNGKQQPNPSYVQPDAFLRDWSQGSADPLEAGAPQLHLADPQPSDGRRAVAALATTAGVASEGLVAAVSEVLSNAHVHGQPPVALRGWSSRGRVVLKVSDGGPGPADPIAGLIVPDGEATGGRGLWIANQLCDMFSITAEDDGCSVRMIAEA